MNIMMHITTRPMPSLWIIFLIISTFCHLTIQKDAPETEEHVSDGTLFTQDDTKAAPAKSYNILVATFCFRGHFNPASGITRALVRAGHQVTVFLTDSCSDLVEKFMPGIADYHIRPVAPNINVPGDPFEAMNCFDEFFRLNNTVRIFNSLDQFIATSSKKYDLLFGNMLSAGMVIAGRKHNIPVVSQYNGPLAPTAARFPSLFEKTDLPMKDPSERPSLLAAIGNSIFLSLYEATVSYKVYNTIQNIHKEHGWESVPYGYGRFPIGYIQRYSIMLSHGAPPLTRAVDEVYENTVSIGFVPDDVMYPPLSEELSDWIEKADGPIVFISLGTVIALTREESQTMFNQLMSQQDVYFIWAVTTPMLTALNISAPPFFSERLIVGRYLPQGNILQHPKVKLFATHCGANSIQDTVHAAKPMVTYPGFADQPLSSNFMVSKKVAKLMKKFTYNDMKPLLDELLAEPTYSQMVQRLESMKREQVNHGGFARGVKVIEDVIEGKIVLNKSVDSADVIGYPLGQMAFICSMVAIILLSVVFGSMYCLYKLIRWIFATKAPKKAVGKAD